MDSTLLLIVAIVSVAIGYAGGAVITASRANKKTPKDDESVNHEAQVSPTEHPVRKPIKETPAPIVEPAAVAAIAVPVDPNRMEIATLWRELPNGALHADLAGSTIKTAKELSTDQRSQLKALQEDLGNWLGLVSPAVLPAVPSVPMTDDMAVFRSAVEITSQPVMTDAGLKKIEETIPPTLIDQPTVVPVERKAPLSIVDQIDEILQAQIKGTSLESRGIRLVESATHGVTVWIGIKAYQGMDAIPDAEVNVAIRRAVKEWEARK